MRILHLLASPYFSGPAELVAQLASAQRTLGHDVTVAVDRLRNHTPPSEELAMPRFAAADLLSPLPLELSVKSSPLSWARDIRTLKRAAVDVVHCHFSHDHLLARFARLPTVVRSIHAARSLRWSTPAAHGWTVPTDDLARKLIGCDVLVLPPLVDDSFRPAPNAAATPTRIGMVSTFQPSRRHDIGLAAFRLVRERHPGATLTLIGDGVLEAPLRAAAQPFGDAVRFSGYLSGAAFAEALRALDEVWVLGLGNDFSGRAAAQAKACGLRVVAVDEGALTKWADAVVPSGAELTAQAVADLALQPERRAVRLESVESVARRTVELYGRVVGLGTDTRRQPPAS